MRRLELETINVLSLFILSVGSYLFDVFMEKKEGWMNHTNEVYPLHV